MAMRYAMKLGDEIVDAVPAESSPDHAVLWNALLRVIMPSKGEEAFYPYID